MASCFDQSGKLIQSEEKELNIKYEEVGQQQHRLEQEKLFDQQKLFWQQIANDFMQCMSRSQIVDRNSNIQVIGNGEGGNQIDSRADLPV